MSDDGPHVSNENAGGAGVFSELLRLQTEFQARLAEETLTYLRRVQGAAAPASPGTVLVPHDEATLNAGGAPGSIVELRLEVENRQRVHCVVTPMISPLVSAEGVTWIPAAEPSNPSTLVPPGQVRTLALVVPLPAELPPATYRGALLLQGFRDGGVAVAVEATAPPKPKPKPKPNPKAKPKPKSAAARKRGGARSTPAAAGRRAPKTK